jgi:hypothetical protein
MNDMLWSAALALVVLVAFAFLFVPVARRKTAEAARSLGERLHDVVFALQVRNGLILGMATLAVDKARPYELGTIQEYPVIAADIIYEGAAVGENASGYARPLVAGDPFLGFAESKADNSLGAAGGASVRVRRKGQVQIPVAGATAVTANDGPLVYASDDDTFTLTASTNSIIGRVSRWVSSGVCVVEFDAGLAAAEAARVAGDV